MTWLARTPSAVVHACLVMLPRLGAEEAQAHVTQVHMGSGLMPADAQQRVIAAWSRAMEPPASERPVTREGRPKATAGTAAAMGFGVRLVQTQRRKRTEGEARAS